MKKKPKKRKSPLVPLWAIPVLIAMAIGTVWVRLWSVRTTYAIDETDRMIRGLQREQERAELRLASLRSPKRLEGLARTRFGLAPPRRDQVIHLK